MTAVLYCRVAQPWKKLAWTVAGLTALALIAWGVVRVTGMARHISALVRAQFAAPGPPLAASDVHRVLAGVPVPPSFTFDTAASNDPRTRVIVGMVLGRGRGEWILAFAAPDTFNGAARWYDSHLPGWTRGPRDDAWRRRGRSEEKWREGVRQATWYGPGRGVTLAAAPQLPGRLLLLVPAAASGRASTGRTPLPAKVAMAGLPYNNCPKE